ncbi:ATP-binding protein [Streptomyces decoyicus]|uniref:ATP-binding protein n=1 Tax=Streptomyces decoyicus TaxID=249567 RepID=UPI0036440266
MTRDQPDGTVPGRVGDTHSQLSGQAENVVQAGAVSGGVHFHHSEVPEAQVPRQLPRDVWGFVGRAQELASLDAVLGQGGQEQRPSAIVAIGGTGGVGKTSLALHWAHRIRARFLHGQLYVNLRGYGPEAHVRPADALERFLRALGVPAQSIPSDLEDRSALYRSLIAERNVLVVLDNAATAGQIRPLLPGGDGCLVIVTSRSRLPSLIARDGAHRLSLEPFTPEEAISLVQVTTDGYREADSPEELAELTRACAHLPLAVRIAAERAASRPHLSLRDLIDDLHNESMLWEALSSDDGDEADSVRAVFSWSYRVLPAQAARLFRLLGLHPGPEFSADAAAALSGQPTEITKSLLDLLVGSHLLEQLTPDRYQYHDLLRAYAADQAHQEEPPEQRHRALCQVLTWYLHSAVSATAAINSIYPPPPLDPCDGVVKPQTLQDQSSALRWYQAEKENLLAATQLASDHGLDQIGWQLPAVLHGIHADRPPFEGWFTMGELGLQAARRQGDKTGEALIQATLGAACRNAYRKKEAVEHYQAALKICCETGDLEGQQQSINALGILHLQQHQLDRALEHFKALKELAGQTASPSWQAVATGNFATTYVELGDLNKAAHLAAQALDACQHLKGDLGAHIDPLLDLSTAHRGLGHPEQALAFAQQALTIAQERDNLILQGFVLLVLGHAQRANGQRSEALESYQHSAVLHRQLRDRAREAQALDAIGETYQELDRIEEAADFHRAAVAMLRTFNNPWYLALALEHLADALSAADGEQSRRHREEAASLIEQYNDPKALAMRERLTVALHNSRS